MKYTHQQIIKARLKADQQADFGNREDGGKSWTEVFAEALGLTVEDPKPEPGVYFRGAALVIVDRDGHAWDFSTGFMPMSAGDADPHDLTPARVVPAEPVELTEEQVRELWDDVAESDLMFYTSRGTIMQAIIRGTVNAALAKYGHGVA